MAAIAASFLGLPVELRLDIYKLVFNKYDGIYPPNILLVSRQIRLEALPICLGWTRYFSSFESLIEWTTGGNPHLLEHVKDVSIQVLDDRWRSLRDAASQVSEEECLEAEEPNTAAWWKKRLGQIGDPFPTEHLAREEAPRGMNRLLCQARQFRKMFLSKPQSQPPQIDLIDELWTALLRMPNVRDCWVNLAHRNAKMEPLSHAFLEMISVAFPRMSRFTFFSRPHNIEFLRNFKHLRLLRFTGRSTNTPDELLAILLSLKALDSLSLYRYPEYYDVDYGGGSVGFLSLTESVIVRMRPLASLEVSHMNSRLPSKFLTVSMLEAWKSHLPSLRVLKIGTDERLDVMAITELLELIARSRLTRLQVRSQGDKKPLDISTYLPPSLKHCDAALKCDEFKGTGSSGTGT